MLRSSSACINLILPERGPLKHINILHISGFDRYLCPGPPSASALSPVPHLLGAALAAVRSQPSEQEFRRSGEAAAGEASRSWADSQYQPQRSLSVLASPVQSEAGGDYNSRYVDQQQQQQQSDYYNSSGALSPSIFDQFQPYSSEEAAEGKRQSHSRLFYSPWLLVTQCQDVIFT